MSPRNGHVNGANDIGSKTGFIARGKMVTKTPSLVKMPPPLEPRELKWTWQATAKFDTLKTELLFVTVNGTSNGEANEGDPAVKDGPVGQNGPQNCAIFAPILRRKTNAPGMPTTRAHKRALEDIRSFRRSDAGSGNGSSCCGSSGGVVSGKCFYPDHAARGGHRGDKADQAASVEARPTHGDFLVSGPIWMARLALLKQLPLMMTPGMGWFSLTKTVSLAEHPKSPRNWMVLGLRNRT
jgi:hypothetical protein